MGEVGRGVGMGKWDEGWAWGSGTRGRHGEVGRGVGMGEVGGHGGSGWAWGKRDKGVGMGEAE